MWKFHFAFVAIITIAGTAPTEPLDFILVNEFAFRLLENTYAFQEIFGTKNLALSPISVWSIFSLLAEGASGQTFRELVKELKLPSDPKATQALHLAVNAVINSNSEDVRVIKKSAMFNDCTLQIHPEFCEAATVYNTDIYSVDPTNTTKLAKDINYFICVVTEGKMKNTVTAEQVENLRMILVDALYFKAAWTHSFDPTQTKEESFYNSQGKTIGSVNMMYHKAPHSHVDVPQIGAQVLEMTYGRDEQFSMQILLPFDGIPVRKLLNNLATQPANWMIDYKTSSHLPIDVYIPRFKIAFKSDLINALQYMGIQSIFDGTKAELPGVSDSPLFVSKTVQNVEIEVNEEGTEAAAATVVGLDERFLGQRFEANREFVFLITHRQSGVILFAGAYSEPSLV